MRRSASPARDPASERRRALRVSSWLRFPLPLFFPRLAPPPPPHRSATRSNGRTARHAHAAEDVFCLWILTTCVVAPSRRRASRARLYLGLPNGTNVAYVRNASDATLDPPARGRAARRRLLRRARRSPTSTATAITTRWSARAPAASLAFQNSGSDAAPIWIRQPGWDPGYDVGDRASPALADLDRDGDLDLLVGNTIGDSRRRIENIGSTRAPAWRPQPAWDLRGLRRRRAPGARRLDRDGRVDLLVGREQGEVLAFAGTAGRRRSSASPNGIRRPRSRRRRGSATSTATVGSICSCSDSRAVSTAIVSPAVRLDAPSPRGRRPIPGSGPAVPALVVGIASAAGRRRPPSPRRPRAAAPSAPTGGTPTDRHATDRARRRRPPARGTRARPRRRSRGQPARRPRGSSRRRRAGRRRSPSIFDARALVRPDGAPLRFSWDFGDGTTAGGAPPADPAATLTIGADDYEAAKATRDADEFAAGRRRSTSTTSRSCCRSRPSPRRADHGRQHQAASTASRAGTCSASAHDLGGIYLYRDLGTRRRAIATRARSSTRESRRRRPSPAAFRSSPTLNGTNENIAEAFATSWPRTGCAVPAPQADVRRRRRAAPRLSHTYAAAGSYVATRRS